MNKPRPLTVKQTKFVKEYVKNDGNGTQAALKTYDVKDAESARALASENLSKLNVKDAIDKALAKHEITMDAAMKPIADGLHATRTIPTSDGFAEGVDHTTRLKASGMALRLLGADKQDGPTVQFNFKGNANFSIDKYRKDV